MSHDQRISDRYRSNFLHVRLDPEDLAHLNTIATGYALNPAFPYYRTAAVRLALRVAAEALEGLTPDERRAHALATQARHWGVPAEELAAHLKFWSREGHQ